MAVCRVMTWRFALLSAICLAITDSMAVTACGQDWFGPRCQYKCHCTAKVDCPSCNRCDGDGECSGPTVCGPGWFGPACQYVDMANTSAVVTFSNRTQISVLTDGDDQSCLRTPSQLMVMYLKWNESFPFTWLRLHVNKPDAVHDITVKFKSNGSEPHDCNNPRNATVNGSSLDVYCDIHVPIKAITLRGKGVQALCSVYVSGGRNVALLGHATQSSQFHDNNATRAVDGNTDSDLINGHSCTHTDLKKDSATWSIPFSRPQLINRVRLYNRVDCCGERLQGFILTASSRDNKTLYYRDNTSHTQAVYQLIFSENNTQISGVSIEATYKDPEYDNKPLLTLCEVELYGDTVCPEGTYGRDCEKTCNCSGECFVSTGGCPAGCPAGYQGENCLTQCSTGYFGVNCKDACSPYCGQNGNCQAVDGVCIHGCQAGYMNPTCNDTCGYQLYGLGCSNNCSRKCVHDGGRVCEPVSGNCLAGCRTDYKGLDCEIAPAADSMQDPSPAGAVIGAVVAGVILVVAAVIIAFMCWRRRKYSTSDGRLVARSHENMDNSDDGASNRFPHIKMYELSRPNKLEVDEPNSGSSAYNSAAAQSPTEEEYCNLRPVSIASSNTHIAVKELDVFMSTHDSSFFKEQFSSIPDNEEATMVVGQSSENKNKNRYKNICAYDHSRVLLQASKHKKHGDYINASYVEGYKGEELFIASQGPTKAMLGDFAQMLWEQQVDKVVMLTNLVEEGKSKCERYWPEEGEIKLGEITVKLATTQVFADYTIRVLQLSMKGGQVQTATHFHFTSWPDKDVPTAPWGLVDFEQRVASYPSRKPILVHCSAGVGRTGTFIALRNVMRQAEDTGYVDVFSAVSMLRRSRAKMVQTADQYEFLHKSAQVAILCMGTTVTSGDVQDRIQQLSLVSEFGNTNMEQEFQAVSNICNEDNKQTLKNGEAQDESHGVYENSLAVPNISKNRFSTILAKEDYMVILKAGLEGLGNYINAVFVPSFTKQNQQILTQLPLPTTVTDFWRLVIQYKVSLVVAFEADLSSTDKTVGTYLPQSEQNAMSFEHFSVRTEQITSKPLWQQQDIVITGTSGKLKRKSSFRNEREKRLTHLKCTSVDLDPGNLLSVVKQARSLAPVGEHRVVYMCRNGADYCGLACVLSLLLDRMDSDNRLTIPLVVGAVKAIRPQVIPTLTQYRLLYDVLSMYIDSVNVYSNF